MSAFETTAVNGLLKGLLVTVLVGMLMACGGGGECRYDSGAPWLFLEGRGATADRIQGQAYQGVD